MSMRRLAQSWLGVFALAVLALAPGEPHAQDGEPLTPEEEASFQEIRDFVQATAERYRMVAPLEVSIAPWVGSGSLPQYATAPAVYARGTLYVSRRLLRASNRDLVIAKALAFELLRAPSKATSLAERDRERAALSLEGNARAVAILVEVRGMTEEAALEQMYEWLLAIHRSAAGRRTPSPGGVTACDEISSLLQRHPGSRARFVGRECAPP
jgi:hypothetical protein